MKQQIKINEVNVKESQAGTEFASVKYLPYGRSSLVGKGTEVGTCWDKDIYEKLYEGKSYNVDIQKSKDGKFNNIRKLYEDEATTETAEEVVKEDKFSGARVEKNKSFYTAYAKDIFIAMLQNAKINHNHPDYSATMSVAVKLVKQAEEGF